jgi:ribose-phosphate pyrophosphokinase
VRPLVLPCSPRDARRAEELAAAVAADVGAVEARRFPDGEAYVRLDADASGRDVVIATALDRPDEHVLPLWFLADAARDAGASSVVLAAPYLPYLRQDARFRRGEALTSDSFARWVGAAVDGVVTVEPHLHRRRSIRDVYRIPAVAATAAPAMAAWIRREVDRPAILGPDEESEPWVRNVAETLDAPWATLRKRRRGDREVEVTSAEPLAPAWRDRTVVVVDDVASTGRTLVAAVLAARGVGAAPPVCVVVHGLFVENAYESICAAGGGRVVSCDTVAHPSNAIPTVELLADALRALRRELGHERAESPVPGERG